MDASSTHIPMIGSIFLKSKGPVLEMGCGYYSTYFFHEMCRIRKRRLVSIDEKSDWLNKFRFLANDYHEFYFVKDWASFSLIDEIRWGMVLVDHAPGERRKVDIDRLKSNADFLVVHDTEEPGYEYEGVLSSFKYRFNYRVVKTETSVVSNVFDLRFLNE